MPDFLFYLFAALTVMSAFLVTMSRNAVNGAMFMIVSLVGMAALFVLLEAYFLAALQVLVYAGAVMVLFLFIIMLLDADKARSVRKDRLTTVAATIGGLLLIWGLVYLTYGAGAAPTSGLPEVAELPLGMDEKVTETIVHADQSVEPTEKDTGVEATLSTAKADNIPFTTSSRSFGYGLFTKYMLPFQVTGFLLLIAMVGVIVLSKKLDATGNEPAKPKVAKS